MGNDSELNIVVKAKNDASKVLKDVNDDTNSLAGNLKGAFSSAVGPSQALMAGVTAAGVAVTGFGVASVMAYGEAQLASAQLDAVLQSTGNAARVTKDELMAQSTALQSVTMFSDEAVQATQAMLLTFTNLKDNVMKDATVVALDMAQALGMDGKQAAMQLGKALNDPSEGLSKLTRVGVTFTEEQEKQVKAMQEAGDVAGAQGIILAELTKEFGGSAEAAGKTFPGQLEILKNTFGDLMEGVGEFITGALQPVTVELGKWMDKVEEAGGLMEYLKGLWNENKTAIKTIAGAIMAGLVPALVAGTAAFIGFLAPLVPFMAIGAALAFLWEKNKLIFFAVAGAVVGFGIAIAVSLIPSIIAATTAFGAMAVAVIAATWPFVLIGAAAAAAIYLIVTNFQKVKDFIGGVINWIKSNWEIMLAVMLGPVGMFVALIINNFHTIWNTIRSVFGAIGGFFSGVWNNLVGIFKGLGTAVGNAIAGGFKGIINTVITLAENQVNGFIRLINGAINIINKIPKVNIPQIGLLSLPRLETGAVNFAGGTALVGERGPELVTLPKGSNVYTAPQTKDMLSGGGVTNNFYGKINLNTAEAVREFFNQQDRNSQLAMLGVPT